MSPPAWFFGALVAMQVLHVVLPGGRWLTPPATVLGVVPIALGAALHAWALRAFRTAGTTVEPEGRPARLVLLGPYARTRNPMYLAGAPILVGLATLLGTVVPVLVVLVYLGAATRWVEREESLLSERFGEEWERYRASVPRWL